MCLAPISLNSATSRPGCWIKLDIWKKHKVKLQQSFPVNTCKTINFMSVLYSPTSKHYKNGLAQVIKKFCARSSNKYHRSTIALSMISVCRADYATIHRKNSLCVYMHVKCLCSNKDVKLVLCCHGSVVVHRSLIEMFRVQFQRILLNKE